MPKGFAHPYLIVAILVLIGASAAVFSGSGDLAGFVLGTRSQKENIYQDSTDGVKVTILSPKSSWDLVQYLCKSREECEQSPTSGTWWSTVSGAPTESDGYTASIDRSEAWSAYSYVKVYAKSASGSLFSLDGSAYPYFITSTNSEASATFVFTLSESK